MCMRNKKRKQVLIPIIPQLRVISQSDNRSIPTLQQPFITVVSRKASQNISDEAEDHISLPLQCSSNLQLSLKYFFACYFLKSYLYLILYVESFPLLCFVSISYQTDKTDCKLFALHRFLHVCSELSEEALPPAVLYGVYQ